MTEDEALKAAFFAMYDRSLNHGDFGPTLKMCEPDAAFLGPNGMVFGTDAIIALIESQRAAFDGFRYEVEFIFANQEGVGVVSVTRGRHMRELFGVPASGRDIEIRMLSIHRLRNGRSIGGYTSSHYVETLRAAFEQAKADGDLPTQA
jgi:predicted ester cyclase